MNYWLNLAIAIDQFFNALFGGACDETLSSRAHRLKIERGRKIPSIFINVLFFWQNDHCKESYESELERLHVPSQMRGNLNE